MRKNDSVNPGGALGKILAAVGAVTLIMGGALLLDKLSARRGEASGKQDETDDDFEDEDFFLQKDVLAS